MGLYSISKGGIEAGAGGGIQQLGVFAVVLEKKFDSQHPCPVAYNFR